MKNNNSIILILLTVFALNVTAVNTYANGDINWNDVSLAFDYSTENTELIESLKSRVPDMYDISIAEALSSANVTEWSVAEYDLSKYLLVKYGLNNSDYWVVFYVD